VARKSNGSTSLCVQLLEPRGGVGSGEVRIDERRSLVNRWRRQYLTTRREAGIDQFAVFNFRLGNASPQVINDVLPRGSNARSSATP
jgi:hypothetical protein